MVNQFVSMWINVFRHPSEATFDKLKPSATKGRTVIPVAIAAIVSSILSFVVVLLTVSATVRYVNDASGALVQTTLGPTVAFQALVNALIQTFVAFYLFSYVVQYTSRRFLGGKGNFDQQAFLISTIWAPVSLLVGVLSVLQCIGWVAAAALVVYAVVLVTWAVQSGQSFGAGKAVQSWVLAGVATGAVLYILNLVTGGWL